jgi:hypothetical protein
MGWKMESTVNTPQEYSRFCFWKLLISRNGPATGATKDVLFDPEQLIGGPFQKGEGLGDERTHTNAIVSNQLC